MNIRIPPIIDVHERYHSSLSKSYGPTQKISVRIVHHMATGLEINSYALHVAKAHIR